MASLMKFEYRPEGDRTAPRKLSSPRERTLTELGLRDTRFDAAPETSHHLIADWECARLRCYAHDKEIDMDCGS